MAELDYSAQLTLGGALNSLERVRAATPKEATMAAGKCELVFPKLNMSSNGTMRSARAMDAEDAQFAGATMRYALCQAWELLKALTASTPTSTASNMPRLGVFAGFNKPMP